MTVHLGHKTSKFHRIVSALNTEEHFCHMRAIINYHFDTIKNPKAQYFHLNPESIS